MISLSERFEKLSTITASFMSNDINMDVYCQNMASILDSLHINNIESIYNSSTTHIETTVMITPRREIGFMSADKPFGVRVLPTVCVNFPNSFTNSITSKEFIENFHSINKWTVEIDGPIFDPCYGFNPDEIASMIIFDYMNVVFTDDIPELLYDTFNATYMDPNIYMITDAKMHLLFKLPIMDTNMHPLFKIPIMDACIMKNWIRIGNAEHVKAENAICVTEFDCDDIGSWSSHLVDALNKMVRHFGSQWIASDDDKYKKIMSDMEWVFRRSYDFTSRKYYLRDEIIRFAMQSCSITYRNHCKDILCALGIECHEVYSGALIENWDVSLFDNQNLMQEYRFDFNAKKCNAMEAYMNNKHSKQSKAAMESIFHKDPLLPSDKEIDLCFVSIDQMVNQSDRRWALDKIYHIEDEINKFEEFYAHDDAVMRRYSSKIANMRRRLNQAREEVLDKKSFKKNYRVFVEVPDGYEG